MHGSKLFPRSVLRYSEMSLVVPKLSACRLSCNALATMHTSSQTAYVPSSKYKTLLLLTVRRHSEHLHADVELGADGHGVSECAILGDGGEKFESAQHFKGQSRVGLCTEI